MDVKQEMLDIAQKVWTKIQALPRATPLEVGAFCVLVIFFATFLFITLLTCINCCCCRCSGKPKHLGSRVRPIHPD